MAIAVTSATTSVVCPSCGESRYVSSRTARRGPGKCRACLYPVLRGPVDDLARRFWLRRFTDEEIAEMAGFMFCRPVSVEHIRRERERLFG